MIEVIENVLNTEILSQTLIFIPKFGANSQLIVKEEVLIKRKFSKYLKQFLMRWNGIDLEVLRIFCCGESSNRLKRFADEQFEESYSAGFISIGSSPAGFIYLENEKAEVYSFDTDGGDIEFIAENLEVFFTEFVFGNKADEFMGKEWKDELHTHSLL